MATKKSGRSKKSCGILDALARRGGDAEAFVDTVRGLCIAREFSPGRKYPGVTFLFPEGKALEKIYSYTDSADEEEEALGIEMILSLIVLDVVRTASDFKRDIPNRRGRRLKVEKVDSKNKVTFANGAVATLDTGFHPASRRNNVAIWKVDKLPFDKPDDLPVSDNKGAVRATGGSEAAATADRAGLADAVLASWGAAVAAGNASDPFMDKVASLLQYLQANDAAAFQVVCPLVDPCPMVSFFVLLEPYKQAGHLLGDATVAGWLAAPPLASNPKSSYESFLGACPAAPAYAAARSQALAALGRVTYGSIRGAYEATQKSLPDETRARVDPDRKMWQDFLRCWLWMHKTAVDGGGSSVAVVAAAVRGRPGNDPAGEVKSALGAADAGADLASTWVGSASFLYLAGLTAGGDDEMADAKSAALDATSDALDPDTICAKLRAQMGSGKPMPPEVAAYFGI